MAKLFKTGCLMLLWAISPHSAYATSPALEYHSATIGIVQQPTVTMTPPSSEDGIPPNIDIHSGTTTDTPAPQQRWADHTSAHDPPLLTGFELPNRDYSSADLSYDYDATAITIPTGVAPKTTVVDDIADGSFSIIDWNGYPAGVPKPQGPFRLLESAEYDAARKAANRANQKIRRQEGLVGEAVDIHEIKPVKFDGSPTDPINKIILDRDLHRQEVTPWWNRLQGDNGG